MTLLLRALRQLLALALFAAAAAHAQDAANGKVLYNTRFGSQAQGCYSCHGIQGSTLKNVNKIANGANNPTVIQNAINSDTGGMGFLKPYLNATQIADIAAYLGNPGLVGLGTPAASVSPASLTFASTTVGSTSAGQAVTLSNTGTGSLSISAIASSSAAFRVTGGTCQAGGSVAAGASCTVTLAFAPSAGGAASGTLTITHNASPTTSTVAMSGTGVVLAPVASVAPASLSFSQVVGTTSSARSVTVSNTGNAALVLGTLTIGGTAAGDYAIAPGGTCASNGSIAAGGSCTIAVTFTPAATGTRTGSLSIPSNAAGSPLAVALNGSGTSAPVPVLALDRNTLAFGNQVVGTASAASSVKISNTGSATMTLASLSVAGANAADFTLGGTCRAGGTVAAGGSCTVAVTFTPAALGTRAATLSIASDASNNGGAASVSLSGSGVAAPAPVASLSPASIDFGAATVGAPATTRSVTLSNTGRASMSISGVTTTGTGYSSASACGATLAAGASCTITVSFAPPAAASYAGALSVATNAAGSPATVSLAGTGALQALPVLSWTPATPDGAFADIATGSTSAPRTFSLGNAGPGTATLSAIGVQGAAAADFATGGTCGAGTALAAGQSCTVTVAFAPSQVGARTATLDVTSDATNPAPVALSGNGVATAQSVLSLSTTTIAFPDSPAGTPPAPVPLLLSNTGNATLSVSAVSVGMAAFQVAPSAANGCAMPPLQLAPGQQCAYDVAVAAGAAGTYDSTLAITSDAATAPGAVPLHAVVTGTTASPGISNAGGGGCSIARPGQLADPVLAGLAAAAALVLWLRRRRADSTHGDVR